MLKISLRIQVILMTLSIVSGCQNKVKIKTAVSIKEIEGVDPSGTQGNENLPAKDASIPTESAPKLTNVPLPQTNSPSFNIVVESGGLYQYAIITAADSCKSATYNGTWMSAGTSISGSMESAGTYKISVVIIHEAGTEQNPSEAVEYIWEYDNAAPLVSISNSGSISAASAASYTISGTCSEAGRTVSIGGSVSGSATCTGVSYAAVLDYSGLPDGNISVTANLSDSAGNQATQASVTLTKSSIATSVSIGNSGYINAANAAAYVVTGSCSPSGNTVTIGGSASGSGPCSNGSYSVSLDYSSVIDGSITITADYMSATQASTTLTKKVSLPTVTISGSLNHINATLGNVAGYVITGTCSEEGRAVTVGGTMSGTGTCNSGAYSVTINYSSIADGSFTITADHSDVAGNPAVQASLSRIKDLIAPTVGTLSFRSVRSDTSLTGGSARAFINFSWTPSTDNVDAQNALQYELHYSGSDINSLALAKAAPIRVSYATNKTSATDLSRAVSSAVYYNVIVKDTAGNEAAYSSVYIPYQPIGAMDNVVSLGPTSQRKSFYDTINQRHWIFGFTGTQIVSRYSVDNANWNDGGSLNYSTNEYAVVYRAIAGVAYVFIAIPQSNGIVLRRGTLGAAAVTYDAEQTVFSGSSAADAYSRPNLAFDDNDYLWVAAVHCNANPALENYLSRVRRSSNVGSGDLSAWNAYTDLGSRVMKIQDLVLMPRGGNSMFLVTNAPQMSGYEFDGSGWNSANTGGVISWTSYPSNRVSGVVRTVVARGTDLYVGGDFTSAGGVPNTSFIAKWDGSSWTSIGLGGMIGMQGGNSTSTYPGSVTALAFDSTGNLYAAGNFTRIGGVSSTFIAKWNGHVWLPLSTAISLSSYNIATYWTFPGLVYISALAIDGSDNIYLAGTFTKAAGVTATGIIKLTSTGSASSIGSLTGGTVQVRCLAWDNVNSLLYAGGDFTNANGSGVGYLAKWDGSAWSAVGAGGFNGSVFAVQVNNGVVYAGGRFTSPGTRIAKYDGANWVAMGSGADGIVESLYIDGSDVFAGGQFTSTPANRIAKWNGSAWAALGSGVSIPSPSAPGVSNGGYDSRASVLTIAKTSSGKIYAGGAFGSAGGVAGTANLAAWDGSSWSALGSNSGTGMDASIYAMVNDGSGNIYLAGDFTYAGSVAANRVVKWNGSAYSALGSGMNGTVNSLAWDSSASVLYAGGSFTSAGGVGANGIAKWNGSAWSAMGTGISSGSTVFAINVQSSTAIYIGGNFSSVGGVASTARIAKWNGSAWSALSTGLGSTVYALTSIGTKLYVGGAFSSGPAGGSKYCSTWSAGAWGQINGATGCPATVFSLANDGTNVYIGTKGSGVRKWDGATLSTLTSGPTTYESVYALFWDGTNLYAAGNFFTPGASIAKWNGTAWSRVGSWGVSSSWTTSTSGGADDYPVLLDSIQTVIVDSSGTVWVGGILGTADGWPTGHLATYSTSTNGIGRGGVKGISAAVDTSTGNIHVARANPEGITHMTYNGSTWTTTPITTTMDAKWSSPQIGVDSGNSKVFLVYRGSYTAVWGGRIYSSGSWGAASDFGTLSTMDNLFPAMIMDEQLNDSLLKVMTLDYFTNPSRIFVKTAH